MKFRKGDRIISLANSNSCPSGIGVIVREVGEYTHRGIPVEGYTIRLDALASEWRGLSIFMRRVDPNG